MQLDVERSNQVLYGMDFPHLRRDLAISSKQKIVQSSEFSDSERALFSGSNATPLSAPIQSFAKWDGGTT
jgi:hypothetical protein